MVFGDCFCADVECEDIEPQHIHAILRTSLCAAFVARQQHIRTDAEDYFIDLVFYNVVLKCYVLVDLKVGKITHQDVRERDIPWRSAAQGFEVAAGVVRIQVWVKDSDQVG